MTQEINLLSNLYSKGKAAYGSIINLQKASGFSKQKVERFLQFKQAHTKYSLFKSKFP